MSTEKEAGRSYNPPYISANVWKAFFDKMRNVNRPPELSVEELKRYALAPGQEPELLSALKFMGLLDSKAKTTDKFKLIQLGGDQFRKNLDGIIHEAYADLFQRHPLDHATYEDLTNYFAHAYSRASAKKMAKSFAVLCQMAGLDSPAFSKMRSLEASEQPTRIASAKREKIPAVSATSGTAPTRYQPESGDDLVREFIKTNPMPTGIQWDAATLKAYFEEYRETLRMLRGQEKEEA